MKRILIRAYTSLNLGDDLFVKILCERYPEHNFFLICPNDNSIAYKNIKNLETITPKRKSLKLLRLSLFASISSYLLNNKFAKMCDVTIHIGGSIFIQPKGNWKIKVAKYRSLISNSKKFLILGCNFGPFEDLNFLNSYKKIFSKIDDISFRDESSYNTFSSISTVRYSPDIVFGLDTKKIKINKNEKNVVLSILDLTHRDKLEVYKEEYEKSIINICHELIIEGYQVILMSFCANEGDEKAINRILSRINNENAKSYFYKGDMENALEIIKSSSAVVATRFHSLILAWILDKPVYPFIYSEKTLNVIQDTGFNGYYSNISESRSLNIDKVISQLTKKDSFKLVNQINESRNHFKILDEILTMEEL